jgi:hypothetical protein
MENWEDVVAFSRTLPDMELAPYYGTPCPKVNGKAFVSPGREADSFCLFTSNVDEKIMLMETEPGTYWETDHYRSYPAVLVRYGTGSRNRIETYIQRSWWDCANKQQRAGFGDRP